MVTPKGLISTIVGLVTAEKIVERLELHILRHHSKDGIGAIIFDEPGGNFRMVKKIEDES